MRAAALAMIAWAASCGGDGPDVARTGEDQFVGVAQVPTPGGVEPRFVLGGRPFSFVANNAYYLQEEATRELGGRMTRWVDETFAKSAALGVRVLRVWAFNDGERDTSIQRAPLVYDEAGLRGLDHVLVKAREYDVKLILTLVNYWSDYGGCEQYVRWAGHADAVPGDPRFFTDRAVIEHFKAHLERVIGRQNALSGIGYWEDPTVLAWELMNEPRGLGLGDDGQRLRGWIDELAGHVRALAPRHLVGTGEEGFDTRARGYDQVFWLRVGADWMTRMSQSFQLNVASPAVDFASVHFYPERYAWAPALAEEAGRRWIAEHAAIAAAHGKPLFVGEFGLAGHGPEARFDLERRRAMYASWLAEAARAGGGAAPWLFAYDERPSDWDPFTWYYRDGSEPGDPGNRYADVVARAAAELARR